MTSIREVIQFVIDHTENGDIGTQQDADNLTEEILAALEQEFETSETMVARYHEIASQIDLADEFRVIVEQDKEKPFGRYYYQIKFWRTDVITGIDDWGYGGKAYLSPHASDNELVQTIFGLYKGVWEHEARESFMWRGRRVFGPHIASQALWDVAKRIDVRNAKHTDDTPSQRPGPDTFGYPQ